MVRGIGGILTLSIIKARAFRGTSFVTKKINKKPQIETRIPPTTHPLSKDLRPSRGWGQGVASKYYTTPSLMQADSSPPNVLRVEDSSERGPLPTFLSPFNQEIMKVSHSKTRRDI